LFDTLAGVELAIDLRERVAPIVLAHELTMPVLADLAGLFTEHALVRGRTLACAGQAATSTAMALVSAAVAAGAWLAVVDVPTFGLDAASEAGIALERLVAISTRSSGSSGSSGSSDGAADWADVIAATVDGFEVVVACVPATLSMGAARKLATRIRQRGAVVVLLGDVGAMSCDGVIESSASSWDGLGEGFGHLRQRTIELAVSGRRLPGRRQCRVDLDACA
jgi:hypothetical protein